jgi:superfamily II DNA or RNA helicase
VTALVGAMSAGTRRPAVVLPTGTGKTVVFAKLVDMVREAGGRAGVMAHRTELLQQAIDKIHDVSPSMRVGVYQGDRREIRGVDAVVCSVGSLTRAERRAELRRAGLSLMIVDECHHATATTYRRTLEDLGAYAEPDDPRGTYAAGVTATMIRGDGVALGHVWQDVVYRQDILTMVRQGFLCPPKGLRVRIAGLDLRKVAGSAGDYQDGALGRAMADALAPEAIARAVDERARDRVGLVFTPTVSLAYDVARALNDVGLSAVAVDGGTDDDRRAAAVDDFRAGRVRWLANCGLFTEGTDLPMANCVVNARPTSSVGLYMQMAGRGLRTWPGKKDCLIMDAVGTGSKYKLASFASLAGGEIAETMTEDDMDEMSELIEELGLLGLVEEAERRAASESGEEYVGSDGPLVYDEMSLFDQSHQEWLQTPGGVWCLVAGRTVIALAPVDRGKYSVASLPLQSAGGSWVVENVDISYAMSWGEKEAGRIEAGLPYDINRKAGWKRGDPSPKTIGAAMARGIIVPTGATAGQVSRMISTHDASRRVDHLPLFAGAR